MMDFPRLLVPIAIGFALVACSPEPTAGTTPERANDPAADAATTTDPKAQSRPSSKFARAVDDAALTTRVKSALVGDASVNGGDISVSSSGGEVTLSGTVPAAQITKADAIARSVQGVSEVINALTPAEPLNQPPS
ncbi:BON domain-containing protein [Aromatoleum sp.]|uniref:BON domain-containing protein n=1 Tax=Aromatoleum sp. TaxID=2307007 RepID=UPI002FCC2E58